MQKASLFLTFAVAVAAALFSSASVGCSSDAASTPGGSADGGDAGGGGASFKADVVPIVQASCALTACHASKQSNLGIFLAYDPTQIYAEFQKTSPTATGEPFVVPGDPDKSYLMMKLEGRQASVAAKCANGTCGVAMPPDNPLPAAKLATLRKWISNGAKND